MKHASNEYARSFFCMWILSMCRGGTVCHVCGNSCHVVIQVYCGCLVFDASSGHSFSVVGCVLSLDGCNDAMVARAVCVVVRDRFPAPVVHVVWWHHFEQGVDPLPELCGSSLCWELRLQRSRSDCFFCNVSQVTHAVTCARQIWLMCHQCRARVCCHREEVFCF